MGQRQGEVHAYLMGASGDEPHRTSDRPFPPRSSHSASLGAVGVTTTRRSAVSRQWGLPLHFDRLRLSVRDARYSLRTRPATGSRCIIACVGVSAMTTRPDVSLSRRVSYWLRVGAIAYSPQHAVEQRSRPILAVGCTTMPGGLSRMMTPRLVTIKSGPSSGRGRRRSVD
jgi:hypothetical protein